MIAYSKERFDNAVAYFAKKHKEITERDAYKTYIFKYIALFDFAVLKATGKPALDTEYAAFENGPVPVNLYDHIDEYESDYFSVEEDRNGNHYIEPKNIDLDYFSGYEKDQLEKIAKEYITKKVDTNDLIDLTHEKIRSWKVAWENRGTARRFPMDYTDEFEDIGNKTEDELSFKEEAFLIHKGLELATKS